MQTKFEWKKEEVEKLAISEYSKVSISIRGYYRWGDGWSRTEEQRFQENIINPLKEIGYEIKEGGSMSSDTLKIPQDAISNLYLHPYQMEGVLKQEDIDAITNVILQDSTCTLKMMKISPLYNLFAIQYKDFILKHAKEIYAFILEKKKTDRSYDAFSFVEQYRIPCLENEGVGLLSSSDIDIQTVQDIMTIGKAFGYVPQKENKIER